MADLTFTAASVRPLIPSNVVKHTADAASMTPGHLVYLKSDGDVALADANAAASVEAYGIIVAIEGGKSSTAIGDVVSVALSGSRVAGFSSLTPGARGYVSETAGDIADAAPSGAGTWTKSVGFAESATVFYLDIGNEPASSNS
jgi:hypothetical protein